MATFRQPKRNLQPEQPQEHTQDNMQTSSKRQKTASGSPAVQCAGAQLPPNAPQEQQSKLKIPIDRHDAATSAGASVSLGRWAVATQSLSFCVHSANLRCGPCDEDTEETEDTASSSSSTSSGNTSGNSQPSLSPAAGDESDSINSQQPAVRTAAFSFGHRPAVTPDLSCTENWELVGALLALGGSL